jgi:hypothetical protein
MSQPMCRGFIHLPPHTHLLCPMQMCIIVAPQRCCPFSSSFLGFLRRVSGVGAHEQALVHVGEEIERQAHRLPLPADDESRPP